MRRLMSSLLRSRLAKWLGMRGPKWLYSAAMRPSPPSTMCVGSTKPASSGDGQVVDVEVHRVARKVRTPVAEETQPAGVPAGRHVVNLRPGILVAAQVEYLVITGKRCQVAQDLRAAPFIWLFDLDLVEVDVALDVSHRTSPSVSWQCGASRRREPSRPSPKAAAASPRAPSAQIAALRLLPFRQVIPFRRLVPPVVFVHASISNTVAQHRDGRSGRSAHQRRPTLNRAGSAARRAELNLLRLAVPRWVADTGQGGVLSLNAQLKQEAMTWRAESPDRQALTGAVLVSAFRVAHGAAADGEMSPVEKGQLVTAAIEVRRGVR
jgi:hypothetical protein